jgi:hypothetical protein
MNSYRLIAMVIAMGATALSLAACTAGISTPSPATSGSPTAHASHPSASASPTASSSPVATVSVSGVGSFPIPPGAQVVTNMPCDKETILEVSSVTPSEASSFYASALPKAGYTVAGNTLNTDPNNGTPQGIAEVTFAGHGYTGLIIALANLSGGGTSMASLPPSITKNFMEVSLSPNGTSAASPGAC